VVEEFAAGGVVEELGVGQSARVLRLERHWRTHWRAPRESRIVERNAVSLQNQYGVVAPTLGSDALLYPLSYGGLAAG
jgi:hypothetical protein